ncbi:hypothetical protein OQA88_3702 [Cercophora sp. LCS_1]
MLRKEQPRAYHAVAPFDLEPREWIIAREMAVANGSSSLTLITDDGGGRFDAKVLCSRCEAVELSIDRFIVSKTDGNTVLETSRYEPRKPARTVIQRSGTSLEAFATFEELDGSQRSCHFCSLLYGAIARYSGSTGRVTAKTTCSLRWEVHGRIVSDTRFTNSTRRIRLSWKETTGHVQEAFLLFVAPRDVSPPESNTAAKSNHEHHFLGRELHDHTEKQDLIKSWLDTCVTEHGQECRYTHGTEAEFRSLVDESYFGVIDVVDMQLKSLPLGSDGKPEPFVTLSYVWGQENPDDEPYVTDRVNIMTRIGRGGLEGTFNKLPRTLQDAIKLVARLGYRYLWIDSLCIVQDSHTSWQLNSQAMHLVYGNSLFTICAADGLNSSTGLRAAEGFLRDDSIQGANDGESGPLSKDLGNGVRLMVTRSLEATVDDSVWNRRAWTFQERVLSRRCLIFAEGCVYFQCRTTSCSQDVHTDGSNKGLSLDRANSPLRTLREFQQRPFWFYLTYVRMYTGRELTKPRDVLAAFRGISWLLERYIQAPSLFGMPASHFDMALLWSPLAKIYPRQSGRCHPEDRSDRSEDSIGFPTWSWTGWMGGRIEYNTAMLEGCLLNVHEWVTRHTWIQWHIRDEKGYLRPLWDLIKQDAEERRVERGLWQVTRTKAEKEESGRWQGYPLSTAHRTVTAKTTRRWRSPVRTYRSPSPYLSSLATGTGDSNASEKPYPQDSPLITQSEGDWNADTEQRGRSPPRRRSAVRFDDNPQIIDANLIEPSDSASNVDTGTGDSSVLETRMRVSNEAYARTRSANVSFNSRVTRAEKADGVDNLSVLRSRYSVMQVRATNSAFAGQVVVRYPGDEGSDEASDNDDDSGYHDSYGRCISKTCVPDTERDGKTPFKAILPDNPFSVIRQLWDPSNPATKASKEYMPILQFKTWRTELHVVTRGSGSVSEGLSQCDILDKAGDWCGSIVLDADWIHEREGHIFQFIAVSDAKAFTVEECPVWTYYVPKERDESEWDLYFVLLLQRNLERGLWERVGVGKVFKVAFGERSWDEIKLG